MSQCKVVETTVRTQLRCCDSTEDKSLVAGVRRSLKQAVEHSFATVLPDGHWYGELMSNATITAEYVFLYQALGLSLTTDRDKLMSWFLSVQNEDGSWGIATDYPGDVSTTTEAYFALKLLAVPVDHPALLKARKFILSVGGVAKVRIFTRIYLATFGLFPWAAVPELPAEFILMPSLSPINIYRLSSWARSTTIPLLIVCHHRPIYTLPNGKSASNDYLDELWCDPEDKMVPYSASLQKLWNSNAWWSDRVGFCFVAIDKILHWCNGLRTSPLRNYSRQKCLDWVLRHQEEQGDWAGIFPPMHVGILALTLEGYPLDSPAVTRGLAAIERFAWEDSQGKRIQACVSPVWDTVLMSVGLCDAGLPRKNPYLTRALSWVKAHQLLGHEGDWQVYASRCLPGGFSFEYFNTWYPDTDDTAAAILAMVKQDPQSIGSMPVLRAVGWVLGMQNQDGGWGAFDIDNDKLFLNKIPFSDMDSLCDPSSADVTGRILEAFGLLLEDESSRHCIPEELIDRINFASERAIHYLARTQEPTGAWYGRWGSNYIYGTSNVLCGLAYFRVRYKTEKDDSVQDYAESALHWLKSVQNSDGGWGESLVSYRNPTEAGCGPSTASQSAWALMGLLAHLPPTDIAVTRGIRYLVRTQTKIGDQGGGSWPERAYTGTGFPNFFYIGYSLYPHYFPLMALGRWAKLMGCQPSSEYDKN